MRRIFIDGPLGESMTVSGELVRHIGLSLRMAVGDRLGVADVDPPFGRQGLERHHVRGPKTCASFSFSWATVKGLTR